MRSEVRAAEQAVIEQSILFTRAWRQEVPLLEQDKIFYELRKVVDTYIEMRLDEADRWKVGTNHPETSQADGPLPNLGDIARQVFQVIETASQQGQYGLTCDEVESRLQGKHQTISARVNELRDRGWIKDSGERRRTRSGRKAIVWAPTLRAIQQRGQQ